MAKSEIISQDDENAYIQQISPHQRKAIQMLADGNYIKGVPCPGLIAAVAEECGVARRTVNYWTHIPEFALAIEAQKCRIDIFAMSQLRVHMEKNFIPCLAWLKARHTRDWDENIRREMVMLEQHEKHSIELPVPTYEAVGSDAGRDDPDHGARPDGFSEFVVDKSLDERFTESAGLSSAASDDGDS